MENEKTDWDLIHQEVYSDAHRKAKMGKMNIPTLIEYFYYKKPTHRLEGFIVGIATSVLAWVILSGVLL